jgi:GT2 family glycosyltransferase
MKTPAIEGDPRLIVVVVTHDGSRWLRECLTSVARQVYRNMSIIVVDSGSEVPAAAVVAGILPQAELMWTERNLGFGKACNYALGTSSNTVAGDFFLFIHDDVQIESDAALRLVETALQTGAGVVGGKGLDWHRPEVLVEVGMTADTFCSPFSGLEAGEIDQGQHEGLRETLFVTNACMLVSRALAARCGLWDGEYFAFGEDMDLCIRARLAGFKVMVQPSARFRHAAALTNGLRAPVGVPAPRTLIRRNRLRTIAKNSNGPRMIGLLAFCLLVGTLRIIFAVVLRRFDQVREYLMTFRYFMSTLPDVLRRRRAVQKRRVVRDRKIRRFMLKESHQARVGLERTFRGFERGTLALGSKTLSQLSPSALRQRLGARVRQPSTASMLTLVLIVLIALRRSLFGPVIAGGSLWPFPNNVGRLMADYLSQWRDVRLGSESAAPVAFPILWLVGLAGFGKAILAQRLLIILSIGLGLVGMNRLVGASTESALARVLGVAVYALGPVVQGTVSSGDLGALALYAGLPFLLEIALRMLGSGDGQGPRLLTPLVGESMLRDAGRLALVIVPMVALGPSSLVAIFLLLAVACLYRIADGSLESQTRAGYVMGAIPLACLLLVPWIFEGMRPSGAILGPIFSGRAGSLYSLWAGRGFVEMLLLNPYRALGGLIAVACGFGALLLPGSRRRLQTRMLAVVWMVFALVGGLAARGLIPPPVTSASVWMVVALAAVAALAGHAVAGIEEELPKHTFGWRHRVAVPAFCVLLAGGVLFGWVPELLNWDRPPATFAAPTNDFSDSISSFLASTASESGDFRVLWLGSRWSAPVRAGLGPLTGHDYFLTGSEGLNLLDMQQPPGSTGEQRLEGVVDALLARRLNRAGHLLAPASIRFVIVDPKDQAAISALRRQRDIALEQQVGDVAIFKNLQWLPRAVLAPVSLSQPVSSPRFDDRTLITLDWSGGREIPPRSESRFSAELPRTRHSQVLLGENFNRAWRASAGGTRLEHSQVFGWSNRFELGPDAKGPISVTFGLRWLRFVWLGFQALMLLSILALARSTRGSKQQAAA